jgi:hypothetical protein
MSLEISEETIARQPPEAQAIIRLLLAKIAELEARIEQLERGQKTPQNSSLPPSAQHPHAKPPSRKATGCGKSQVLPVVIGWQLFRPGFRPACDLFLEFVRHVRLIANDGVRVQINSDAAVNRSTVVCPGHAQEFVPVATFPCRLTREHEPVSQRAIFSLTSLA